MIWLRSVYNMIWLWYDIWMTNIYVVIWYEICYDTRYMINWHVYDMIYYDAICYGMICIWWNVMLKAWDVRLCLLNCVYTAWYEWWKICEMIWKMIWYVQNASGVVLNDNENGKMLGPHA